MAMRRGVVTPLEMMEGVWGLTHALEARSKWMHREFGVTGPQRLLLRVIGESPGCSPGEAARHLRLHPATVTRLLRGVERLGLVQRQVDPGDGRRQKLVLNERGRAINALKNGTVEQAVRATLDETSAEDAAAALALLHRLADYLMPSPGEGKRGSSAKGGKGR